MSITTLNSYRFKILISALPYGYQRAEIVKIFFETECYKKNINNKKEKEKKKEKEWKKANCDET